LRELVSILWSAGEKFLADDGWAIASYIGLTLLTSLFPFLIFVAALAGFLGSEAHGRRRIRNTRQRPASLRPRPSRSRASAAFSQA